MPNERAAHTTDATMAEDGAGPSAAAPAPVVVTSINPFAKLSPQLACWRAWRALGFTALSANVADEAQRLVAAGFPGEAVLPVADEASGRALFGKPLPRIKPLLAQLAETYPDRPILLANADIFPAARDAAFLSLYLGQGPIVALVREDTPTLASASAARRDPYRGGLDAFVMTAGALAKVNAALDGIEVAERMAFGIPGWDYLLGALALSLGGVIMDSGLLLHERHETTYANVDEFLHYVPAMQALNAATGPSAAEAAFQFYHRIDHECRMTAAAARLTRLKYYCQPLAQTTPEARAAAARVFAADPVLAATANFAAIAALADDLIAADRPDMERAFNVLATPGLVHGGAREALWATLLALACRVGRDPPPRRPQSGDRRHIQAVAALAQRPDAGEAAERLATVRLYAVERIEHGIANASLEEYLILTAENDDERALLTHILLPERTPHAA